MSWKEVRLENAPFQSVRIGPAFTPVAKRKNAELDFMGNRNTGEMFPFPAARIRTEEIKNLSETGGPQIIDERMDRFDLSPAQAYGFEMDTKNNTTTPYPLQSPDMSNFNPTSTRQDTPEMQALSDALIERMGLVEKADMIGREPISREIAESTIGPASSSELKRELPSPEWAMSLMEPRSTPAKVKKK